MYLLSILLKNLFGKGHCIGVLLLFKHLIVYEIGSGRNGHLLRSKLSYKQNKNKRNSKFANLFPRGPHIQVLVCVFVYYFFFWVCTLFFQILKTEVAVTFFLAEIIQVFFLPLKFDRNGIIPS